MIEELEKIKNKSITSEKNKEYIEIFESYEGIFDGYERISKQFMECEELIREKLEHKIKK